MYVIARIESRTRTIDMYRSLDGGFGSPSAIRQGRPRVSVDEQRNPGNNVCQSFRRERQSDVVAPDKAANVSLYEYRYAREQRKDGRASSKIPSLAIETRVKMFIRFNGS